MEPKRVINKGNIKAFVISLSLLTVLVVLIVIMCVDLVPVLKDISLHANDESAMAAYMESFGSKGVPIIMALQAIQVITTIFPTAAVQALAGFCYGIWIGAAICFIGYLLGNTLAFWTARQFGATFKPFFEGRKTRKKEKKDYNFIKRSKHPEFLALLLFLLPGVPNGILPYLFASTRITLPRYLLSVAVASVPNILICSWLGDRISKGNYLEAIIVGVTFITVVLLVIIFREKIFAKLAKKDAAE